MLADGPVHEPPVVLSQGDNLPARDPEHGGVHLPVKPGVSAMLHRLGLHRRVDDDLIQPGFGKEPGNLTGLDRGLKGLLHALLPHALAPAGHLAGVDREPMLEEPLPAEELHVGFLTQVGTTSSSERPLMCLRRWRPTTSRVGTAGRPLSGQ